LEFRVQGSGVMAPASLTIKEINNLGFRVKGSWIEDKDL
jgi:hypothetical protein